MRDYFYYLRIPHLIAFFILGALYTFLFLKDPIGHIITLLLTLLYGWGAFAVFSYFTSLIWKKTVKGAIQDPNVVNTFLPANLLFVLFLYMLIATSLNDYMDPRGERSIVWLLIISLPFFTSLTGGILSGTLVLFSRWDSKKIILIGEIVSLLLVVAFFMFNIRG